jgi:hypothetical protein
MRTVVRTLTMELSQFLNSLFEGGRLQVPPLAEVSENEVAIAKKALRETEALYRLSLPENPPALDLDAACRASITLYRACQFVVYRDIETSIIEHELGLSLSTEESASVHYSVDLVFRYLPDVRRFAASASRNDPLAASIERLAAKWPLSSVGMPGIESLNIDPLSNNPCLMQMYVDRILERNDTSRLGDARVRSAIKRSLGMQTQLSPTISTAILNLENESVQE